jgi:hypothetical protein
VIIESVLLASLIVVGASITLWLRQTSDALLRVSSFPGAISEVVVYALPTLVVFVVIGSSQARVFIWGSVIAVLTIWMWSSVANDRHSTASIGPVVLLCFLLPFTMLFCAAVSYLVRNSGLKRVDRFIAKRASIRNGA